MKRDSVGQELSVLVQLELELLDAPEGVLNLWLLMGRLPSPTPVVYHARGFVDEYLTFGMLHD